MSLDTLPSVPVHPTEDLLEEYSFGRVLEPALAPLEEHLLDCTLCQNRLLAVDEYTALMKAGIAAMERERAGGSPSPGFAFPKMPGFPVVLTAAVMLVLVGVTIGWRLQPSSAATSSSTATAVKLTALRGGDGDGVAHVPFGRPLELTVDRTDLPAALAYRLEVVSSTGRPLWSGAAQIAPQNLSARVATRLAPGAYWVRLYSGDQLRREFGLRVE
jgi:hypothetical protein